MKLICEFDNAHEADIAALHYRERGILTHVSNRYSNGLRMITGATTVGFWVVLDQQYQDALVLARYGAPACNGAHRARDDRIGAPCQKYARRLQFENIVCPWLHGAGDRVNRVYILPELWLTGGLDALVMFDL